MPISSAEGRISDSETHLTSNAILYTHPDPDLGFTAMLITLEKQRRWVGRVGGLQISYTYLNQKGTDSPILLLAHLALGSFLRHFK